LLIFWLDDLSLCYSGISKSPLLLCWGLSVILCAVVLILQNWVCWYLVHKCLPLLYSLVGLLPLSIWSDLWCLFWLILVWSLLYWIWNSYSCLIWGSICLEYIFLSSHFSLCLSFQWVLPCRQQIIGSCFSIQLTSLCLLTGKLTIYIESYYWKPCNSNSSHIIFIVFDSFLFFTHLVRFILSCIFIVVFIFLVCV
jgi:hypothetical protein